MRISLVCLGNICRSPMAEVVLRAHLADAGLTGPGATPGIDLDSAGTGSWHVGGPMDARAAATLREAGYDPDGHRARQWDPAAVEAYDLVLAMDTANLAALGGRSDRIGLFRDYDPVDTGDDVPDPYYGGDDGFRKVLEMVERSSAGLVAELRRAADRSHPDGEEAR